jgi:hypothetical protein
LRNRTENLVSVTGFPHVIVSAGMNEVVGLEIPFVYPYNYYDLSLSSSSAAPLARLFVYVLNPLRSADVVPPVDVTIFGNMYDVTLCGYTNEIPVPIVPRIKRGIVPKFSRENFSRYVIQSMIDGGTAQINTEILATHQQVDSRNLNPVKLCVGNPPSTSQTDKEMVNYLCPTSLRDIASKPGLLTTFQMKSINATGTILFSTPVHPCAGLFTDYLNGTLYFSTPLRFVSWPCRLWSGSIKYKLQIVSSKFHSARIQILYTPDNINLVGTIDTDTTFELTSHIVDIQCDSEIEFEIPWNSFYPELGINKGTILDSTGNGTLAFRVLNELTYKELPVPDIEFNLWISAGSDFKLYSMNAPITFDLTEPSDVPPIMDIGIAQVAETSKVATLKNAESIVPFVMGNNVETPSAIEEVSLSHAFATSSPAFLLDEGVSFAENCLRSIESTERGTSFTTIANSPFIGDPIEAGEVISFGYYDWYNLMFRFRRGGYIYTALSMPIDDPIERAAPSMMYMVAGLMDSGTGIVLPRINTSSLSENLRSSVCPNLLATRGSLQSLCGHVPYASTAKFAITNCMLRGASSLAYPRDNATNTVSIVAQRSQCLVYRTPDPDMKFYFQVGPPAIFET